MPSADLDASTGPEKTLPEAMSPALQQEQSQKPIVYIMNRLE